MVKVSIILPIYNVAPFLDDAFLSLINQTLRDIEIIAINDGSTDNSQVYIDKYAKSDKDKAYLPRESGTFRGKKYWLKILSRRIRLFHGF